MHSSYYYATMGKSEEALDEETMQKLIDGTPTQPGSAALPNVDSLVQDVPQINSRKRVTDWRTAAGGIGALASRYGAHNSLSLQSGAEEFVAPEEKASTQQAISSNNKGFQLLAKMGWKANTGLGKNAQGRVDPVTAGGAVGTMGLGKAKADDTKLTEASAERKKLDVEVVETKAMKLKRAEEAARQQQIAESVKQQVEKFYCKECNKGYDTSMQWEEHLVSYDHNHRKRFNETKRMMNAGQAGNRVKKFARSAEVELEAQMKAHQEAAAASTPAPTAIATPITLGGAKMSFTFKPKNKKKGLSGQKRKAKVFKFNRRTKKTAT